MTAEHQTPEDDQVVGKALRLSFALVALVAAIAAVVLVLRPENEDVVPDQEDQSSLPEERAAVEQQIPEIPFADVTLSAGIDFVQENGATGQKLLPETMTGGVAFFDFDGDLDPDILCVNAMDWPWAADPADPPPTAGLYENDGRGQFTNVTAGSGLDVPIYGNGVACGDFDNDGLTDVYLTAVGTNRLFRNLGGGKFEDVTTTAAVGGAETDWGTSAGWFDYDNDGDLDLMHCNYLTWSRKLDESMGFTLDGQLRAYGRPTDFSGAFPVLYRNDGDGSFSDVSAEMGLQITNADSDEPLSKSLGLTFADVNSDGWMDVLIANDTVQNWLLINQQGAAFVESAAASGVAYDNNGKARGAMGIDAACFRNDDAVGITIGNFANEMTALYVCQTPGIPSPIFRDEAVSNGIGPVTRTELTFGVLFADLDLDSRLDIVACNGHLEDDIQKVLESQRYEQPPQILWNCGVEANNEFMILPEDKVGPDFVQRMVGRGAARADIDGDGDIDLLLAACGGRPRLLRNDQQLNHHWLRVRLEGQQANRDGIGATVRVKIDGDTTLTQTVMPTCSYQSQSETVLTFGLGTHASVESLSIRWPGATEDDVHANPTVDTLLQFRQ